MAEYLSPGVYVEEYDSGATPMQGVSTSTAGFIGLAERGPVIGEPQLVTSFADYKRMYGGYLSEAGFGSARFLPYAVEQFFANGGSRAYIMRAVPGDAKAGSVTSGVLKITAASPGAWADNMRVTVEPAYKAKTQVYAVNGTDLTLKNADGFNAGDVVELFDGAKSEYATVKSVLDNVVALDKPCTLDVIKAYTPESKSVCGGQVLMRPYAFREARLIVGEMAEKLSMDLVSKGLQAGEVGLYVCYDVENLAGAAPYHGEVVMDYYGRPMPKPTHGGHRFREPTASTKSIVAAIAAIFDKVVDPTLTVRRIHVFAGRLKEVGTDPMGGRSEQLDLFTDPEAEEQARQAREVQQQREHKAQQAVLDIRKRFGGNAILKGMDLKEEATTRDRNEQIGGHKA